MSKKSKQASEQERSPLVGLGTAASWAEGAKAHLDALPSAAMWRAELTTGRIAAAGLQLHEDGGAPELLAAASAPMQMLRLCQLADSYRRVVSAALAEGVDLGKA